MPKGYLIQQLSEAVLRVKTIEPSGGPWPPPWVELKIACAYVQYLLHKVAEYGGCLPQSVNMLELSFCEHFTGCMEPGYDPLQEMCLRRSKAISENVRTLNPGECLRTLQEANTALEHALAEFAEEALA